MADEGFQQTEAEFLSWRDVNYEYNPATADSHKTLALLRELFERIERLEAAMPPDAVYWHNRCMLAEGGAD